MVVRPANRPLPYPTRPVVSVLSSQEAEPREALITFGMSYVSMAYFPGNLSTYLDALSFSSVLGKVTLERRLQDLGNTILACIVNFAVENHFSL